MRFFSTRDPSCTAYSFEYALTHGYAKDGGLFVPEYCCHKQCDSLFTKQEIKEMAVSLSNSSLSFVDIAFKILRRGFISEQEIPDQDLLDMCKNCIRGYDNQENPIPVAKLLDQDSKQTVSSSKSSKTQTTYISELWHGPTFCFKDLGQQLTIRFLGYFAKKQKVKYTGIVSTTGDTGPAVVKAAADANMDHTTVVKVASDAANMDNADTISTVVSTNESDTNINDDTNTNTSNRLRFIVAHPKDAISDLQRRQMTTVNSPESVRCVLFEGGGDDLDGPIKNIIVKSNSNANSDSDSQSSGRMVGVNSYNIGRPAAQVIHYFWSYLQIAREQLQLKKTQQIQTNNLNAEYHSDSDSDLPTVSFIVPSGALGNLVSGVFAQKLGLHGLITNLIPCTNVNDVTYRVLGADSGSYGIFRRNPVMKKNLAEAMNIQVPYNFERILWLGLVGSAQSLVEDSTDDDPLKYASTTVIQLMKDLESKGEYKIPEAAMEYMGSKSMSQSGGFGITFSTRVTDDEISKTIRDTSPYLLCPHSACGVYGEKKYVESLELVTKNTDSDSNSDFTCVLATAHACKFEEVVSNSLNNINIESELRNRYSDGMRDKVKELFALEEQKYALELRKNDDSFESEWEEKLRKLIEEW